MSSFEYKGKTAEQVAGDAAQRISDLENRLRKAEETEAAIRELHALKEQRWEGAKNALMEVIRILADA